MKAPALTPDQAAEIMNEFVNIAVEYLTAGWLKKNVKSSFINKGMPIYWTDQIVGKAENIVNTEILPYRVVK